MVQDNKVLYAVFQLSKTEIFEVNYYYCGSNDKPYFATSAAVFNQPKSDYSRCGQCQEDVLHKYTLARKFFEKWDKHHLKILSDADYYKMRIDLESLFDEYNHLFGYSDFSFSAKKELSKQKVLKSIKKR